MNCTYFMRWQFCFFAFCLALMALPSACNKEFSVENSIVFSDIPAIATEPVTIQGLVTDENGVPMADATVTAQNQFVKTDRYGIFRFEQIPMNLNGGLVKVSKEGYFEGSRSLFYDKSTTNFIRIRMIRRTISGQIRSLTGGTVKVGDATILFPENAFRLTSGNLPYTGDVKVFAAYLPANTTTILEEMPGNLYGIRSDSGFAGLETLGMMKVELEGSNGESLQLAAGEQATLEIPSTPNPPPVIPMWFFDDVSGFWKEEGVAYRNGSKLIAKVSHFSTWNWDIPYPVVTIKARFLTTDGLPLLNYKVIFKRGPVTDNTRLTTMTVTDSMGYIKGPMPVNEKVTIIIESTCGTPLFSTTIGPINTETDLGNFTMPAETKIFNISGKLTDCNDQNLKKGFFTVIIGKSPYRVAIDPSGNFNLRIINCQDLTSATATGFDLQSYREGDVINIDLNRPSIALGTIKICNAPVQNDFIEFILNQTLLRIESPNDSLKSWYVSDTLKIEGLSEDKTKLFRLDIKTNQSTGLKPIAGLKMNKYIFDVNNRSAEITRFSSVGGTVEGNISAFMSSRDTVNQWFDTTQRKVDVIFRVKRRS